jgi:hypothetical protein
MTKTKKLPMRMAMRVEGDKWNAYIAHPDTMKGAIWIGSIAMRFVENNPERKQAFIDIMAGALSEMIAGLLGRTPSWETQTAPEHERTKE